jgi:hypothetical protein
LIWSPALQETDDAQESRFSEKQVVGTVMSRVMM